MSPQGKLLIRVDANDKIGFGHFYRCLSVALMLRDEWEITFAMAQPTKFLIQTLSENRFAFLSVSPFAYTDPDSISEEVPFDLDNNLLAPYEAILVDGYFFGPCYFEHLAYYPLKVFTINDNPDLPIKADTLINSAPQVKPQDYRSFAVKTLALGLEYSMLRPDFFQALHLPIVERSHRKLLISFGGADRFGITERVTQQCLQLEGIEEVHVIGRIENQTTVTKSLTDFPDKLFVHSNLAAPEVVRIMRQCDLAILPTSGVLFEAIACGLPVVMSWFAENQRPFHDYLVRSTNFHTLGNLKQCETIELTKVFESIGEEVSIAKVAMDRMRSKMITAPEMMRKLFRQ